MKKRPGKKRAPDAKKGSGGARSALRGSEETCHALFEHAREAILLLELPPEDIPVIRDANAAAVAMFGYSKAELMGRPVSILTDTDEVPRRLLAEGKGKDEHLFEVTHRRKDGSVFMTEVSAREITIGGKRLAMAIERDITEQKRVQAALRDSEEKYRVLAEGTSDIPYVLDAGGILKFVGPQVARLGLDPGKMTGRPFLDFIHPEDREALVRDYAETMETGRVFASEFRVLDRKGAGHWMEELGNLRRDGTGAISGIVGILRDITERKSAEDHLKESRDLLDTVVENVPLMIFLKRAEDLRFVLFNRAGEQMLGYDRRALIGKNDLDFFPEEQAGHFMAKDREVLFGAAGSLDIPDEPILNSRGEELRLHTRKVGIRGADGRPKYLLGISEDITARKRAEKERDEMQLQFLQAQKMESVGRLAGGVAHDFNNLLTTIGGYTDLLLQGLDKEDPRRTDVQEIRNAAERATGLTRQLLAFSRRQILNPQVTDLSASVSGVGKMLRRLIGEHIRLETTLSSDTCRAKVDAGQIDHVIINLAINARDAMPEGGVLTLETGVYVPDADFLSRHPGMDGGPLACLTIRDTGCGMTAEVAEHIFEPFFTTKEKGKGTGLGLAMVYGVVKQSGGEIEVESEPGRGSVFRIYFPQSEGAVSEADRGGGRADAAVARGSETILLVEDEESLRRLAERILRTCGYRVISAVDGPRAIAAAERHGKPVDLLLTDVVMPGMSGRELAMELSRRKLALRTLYMSGYMDDAVTAHGVLERGAAFIYKPFTVEAISAKLRAVLDGPVDA